MLIKRAKTLYLILVFAASFSFLRPDAKAQVTMVDLGMAKEFGVLAGSGITVAGAVNSTTINGNIGTFPITSITGLGNVVLNGVNHGGDGVTQMAKNDLLTAYNDAAGRIPTVIYAPASDLRGLTLVSGVYKNPTSFDLNGTLTLDAQGNPNAIWIFQAGSTLTTAVASSVSLVNGAQACNLFWQVGSSATLGTNTDFAGSILALTSITLETGAMIDGRVLALNGAVTLDNNVITVTYCDTIINGTVSITMPTTVNSLDFGGCSSLLLTSDLTVLSGIFNVPSGSAMITGGNIIVPGDFTKIGAGSLVINSLLQVAGNANINQGSLFVNGTLQANQINVSDNAVLGGTGQIIGNVVNAGTVAPGSNPPTVCTIVPGDNSPGVLFVNGNYTQTSTGDLQIEIASPREL